MEKTFIELMKECAELAQTAPESAVDMADNIVPENGKRPEKWGLFDPRRRRCGYDNSKIGAYSATVSAVPGTADSLEYYSNPRVLEMYSDMIEKYGREKCVSCPCHCPDCYADKEKRLFAVMETLLLNTIEMYENPVLFWELVESELFNGPHAKEIEKVRIHECGEFVSESEFFAAMDMMKKHPEMPFFGYSKRDFVGLAYTAGLVPENVKFSCSPWTTRDGVVLCAPISDMHQFIFDDGSDPARDKVVHCYCSNPDGTVNKGNTCSGCGRCIRAKKGTKTAVYPHGVKRANTWLAGRARYYMETAGADKKTAAAAAYRDGMKNARKWAETIDRETLPELVNKLAKAL